MTDDPKRWLSEGSDASPYERELLSSVRDVRPPAHAREQAWQGIAASLAAGAVTVSVAPTAAAATSAAVAVAKTTLLTKAVLTLAAGGIAAGGYLATREALPHAAPTRAHQHHAPAPIAPPTVSSPTVEPVAPVTPLETAAPQPIAPRKNGTKSEAKGKDLLTAESAQLTRARAALRSGDAAGAERVLARMAVDFPRGVLAQEREVLAIEVLAAQGDGAAATRRARAFAKAYPGSPHSTRLRALLDAP